MQFFVRRADGVVDGDGCNNDCNFSGQLLTSELRPVQGSASLYDVSVASTGERIAVGTMVDAQVTGLIVRAESSWSSTTSEPLDVSLNDEYAVASALAEDLSIYVGGRVRDASLVDHPWLSRVAPDGQVLWTAFPSDALLAPAEVRAVASTANTGAFAAGVRTSPVLTATERWLSRVDALGNTQWTVIEDSGFAEDVYHDLLVLHTRQRYAGTQVAQLASTRHVPPTGAPSAAPS